MEILKIINDVFEKEDLLTGDNRNDFYTSIESKCKLFSLFILSNQDFL